MNQSTKIIENFFYFGELLPCLFDYISTGKTRGLDGPFPAVGSGINGNSKSVITVKAWGYPNIG